MICHLCPHECRINPGKRGICRIRENQEGELYALTYGKPVSLAVDPVEKKPLFHVYPGSSIYSVGLAGCNLKCQFCQNYTLSQSDPEELRSYETPPEDVVTNAKERDCLGIAFTYNEPVITTEYALDTFSIAQDEGLYTCFVTNGYINPEPARDLAEVLDCANVDFKSSQPDFYRKLCKAPSLESVKQTINIWNRNDVSIEITNLIMPGHNDSDQVIEDLIDFVLSLGEDTPLHFSRFHPAYKMTGVPPTPTETIENAVEMARKKGLKYVYAGNIHGSKWENTYCPQCGKPVIRRSGYTLMGVDLDEGNHCTECGTRIPLLGKPSSRL